MILAIDPGNIDSAYVLAGHDLKPVRFGKVPNDEMLAIVKAGGYDELVIEQIKSYGMRVGEEVFETCVWTGRFMQAADPVVATRIPRLDAKMNLCHTAQARDGNIIQALTDRFGIKGTKKKPGWFYGFAKDTWQAYAVLVTYADRTRRAP